MSRITMIAAVSLSVLALGACGQTRGERALTGAGIGAAGGAGVGALTGGSVGRGALIGGVAGGALGGLTDPEQLDLGEPVWR